MSGDMGMLRPWLGFDDTADLALVMCPFAGASSAAFRGWKDLDLNIDAWLAIYPGRDHRMHEPCLRSIEAIATALADEITMLSQAQKNRLIVAGHSMGAQVAFETCRALEQRGELIHGAVLSACHAPHLVPRRRLSHLDDQAFKDELLNIGGCDPGLDANPDLLQHFLPLLRADFAATEHYHHGRPARASQLRTPTLLLYGTRDEEAHRDEVAAWRDWMAGDCELRVIPGEHFYVTQRPLTFLGQVLEHFEPLGSFT